VKTAIFLYACRVTVRVLTVVEDEQFGVEPRTPAGAGWTLVAQRLTAISQSACFQLWCRTWTPTRMSSWCVN